MQFVGQSILKPLLKSATSCSLTCSRPASSLVRRTMQAHNIVPDVVPDAPVLLATVSYYNTNVSMGKKITPQETKSAPCVRWPHEEDRLYCMIMLDPDSPTHCRNYDAEWHHWLVGNIPGKRLLSCNKLFGRIRTVLGVSSWTCLQETTMREAKRSTPTSVRYRSFTRDTTDTSS